MNKYSTSSIERNVPLFSLRCGILSVVVACLIAIATNVRVPFFPVPFTLQTLAIVICSACFGRQISLLGLGLFVSLCWTFNPLTCGYILGFCLVPFIVSHAHDNGSLGNIFGRLFLAHTTVLLCGSIWLSCCIGFRNGLINGCIFFVPAEMIKMAIEYIVLSRFRKIS